MVTPQDGYSIAAEVLPEGFRFNGHCFDYTGTWAFPLESSTGDPAFGAMIFVDQEEGNAYPDLPWFDMQEFVKSPEVTDEVEFNVMAHAVYLDDSTLTGLAEQGAFLVHHGIKGMHWGQLSAETLRKYGYGTKKHLAKAEKLRAQAKEYAKKAQTAERRREKLSNIKGPKQLLTKKVDEGFHRVDDLTGQTKAMSYERGDAVMRHIVRKTIGGKYGWDAAYATRKKLNESEVFLTEAKLMQDKKARKSANKAAKLERQARKEDYKAVKKAAKKAGVTLSTSDKIAVKKGDVKADRAIKNIDNRSFETKRNSSSNAGNKAYQKEAKKLERKYGDDRTGKQMQKAVDTSTRKLQKQATSGKNAQVRAEAKARLKARDDFAKSKSTDIRMTKADKASLSSRASRALADASKALATEGNVRKTFNRWKKGYDD